MPVTNKDNQMTEQVKPVETEVEEVEDMDATVATELEDVPDTIEETPKEPVVLEPNEQ